MGEFFAILIAGIDLSVGAIFSSFVGDGVTAQLMIIGVDPLVASIIGGIL